MIYSTDYPVATELTPRGELVVDGIGVGLVLLFAYALYRARHRRT